MLTKRNVIFILTSLFILVCTGVGLAHRFSQADITTLQQISAACAKHKDKDGFGNVTIGGANFQNQTAQLNVACKLHLRPGSSLQMNNVTWRTSNLLIDTETGVDTEADSYSKQLPPSHLDFNRVTLNGNNAGLQITLKDAASTVAIKDSSFDYPLSIGVSVGAGDADTTSSVEVTNSKLASVGQDSEGINLVATGSAVFRNNQFQLNSPDDFALLMGSTCVLEGNTHANDRCQGP